MQEAIKYSSSSAFLCNVNQCRLFLGLFTLVDACSADGLTLAREVYHCTTQGFLNFSLLWPRVPTPGKTQVRRWRRMWHNVFLNDKKPKRIDPRRPGLLLRKPLGRWTCSSLTRQHFDTVFENNLEFTQEGKLYKNLKTGNMIQIDAIPTPISPWENRLEQPFATHSDLVQQSWGGNKIIKNDGICPNINWSRHTQL